MIGSPRLRKALRRLGVVLVVMLALVLLPLAALQFSAVRALVLDRVVESITASLPGELQMRHTSWPRFSHLLLEDVDWTAAGDTLAQVARVELRWDTGAALRRHLHVPMLHVQVSRLDVPGLQRLLASPPTDEAHRTAKEDAGSVAIPWFRQGSLPGVPSAWFEDVRVEARDCRLTDATGVVRLQLGLQADLRAGLVPRLFVDPLQLEMTGPDLEIDAGIVRVDPDSGRLDLTLQTASTSPWQLTASTDTSTPDVVALQVHVGPQGAEPLRLLESHSRLQRTGSQVEGMQVDITLQTPDVAMLRSLPALGEHLQAVPDLQGLTVQCQGAVRWSPEWDVDVQAQLQPNSWVEGGGGHLRVGGDSLVVRDVALQLDGLQLNGDWQQRGANRQGDVHLQVDGSEWIHTLAPDAEVPQQLAVDLRARLTQEASAPRWEARLRAAVQQGATRIDDLLCQAASTSTPQDIRFHVQSRQQGWDVTVSGETALGDSVRASLDPIVLRQATAGALQPRSEPLPAPRGPTRVVWQAQRGVQVHALRLTGDLGPVQAEAHWSPSGNASMTVDADWSQPPRLLLSSLADSLQRRLIRDWPARSAPSIHLQAHAEPQTGGTAVQLATDLVLPGPRTFAFVLPESVQVDDLDVLRGTIQADAFQDSLSFRWRAALDLSQTSWLDSTGVQAHARADSVFLDSLRLLWDGLDVRLSGVADSSRVALEGGLHWNAARWIERIPQARSASLSVDTAARWSIHGSPSAPDVDVSLQAQIGSLWGGVPHLDGDIALRRGVVDEVDIVAPQGLSLRDLSWDRLQLTLRPAHSDHDTLSRLHFDLEGKQQAVRAALRLDLPQANRIQADTLALRLFDRQMVTTQPFTVHRTSQTTRLSDLDMQGTLGSLHADAFVSPDSLTLSADADLQLPPQPTWLRIPPGLWPNALRVQAIAAGNDSFSVSLQTSGLQLAARSQVSVRTRVRADRDSTRFHIDIVDPERNLLTSQGHLPLQWSLRPTHFALKEDSLSLHANFDDFPIPDVFEDPRTAIEYLARSRSSGGSKMLGSIDVDGRLAAPRVRSYLRLQPQDPSLAGYQVHLFVALQQDDSRWAADLQPQLARLSTAELLRPPGAKLAFWVERDTSRVLDAAAHMPVRLGLRDGHLQVESDAQLRAALRSPSLRLSDFAPLLPARTSLGGTLNIDLSAEGNWKDPQLGGGLRFTELSVEVPDGSRVRATGNIEVQGKISDPGVKGKVRVRDGLIRIPELPRSLLPKHGEALLLADSTFAAPRSRSTSPSTPRQTAASAAAAPSPGPGQPGDSLLAGAADSLSHGRLARPPRVASDKEVFLEIPGAFWIRGRGFEVELSGHLQLTVRGGQLRVLGELKAERGDLQLLASKFPIKTGKVLFYGDDETNPSLDLIMGRDYGDVSVEVVVQGTAKDPKIEFRSDPQLTEDEILSYVLFGRGTSQLDETQTSQFDERALALASLLTSNLGEGIREQTGVDMIGLEQSADTADRASLVVGKYLSPRVLLKYVQDLERGRGYAVNVEYWLRGGLRLMTTSSRYDQSGLELNWSHDY
jgi:autotransporter translocation and assembly factor TamB